MPYLDRLDVDVVTFETADNGGEDFEAIGRVLSKDKKVAIGVVSHRDLAVERPEAVADLIRRALKYIEPQRLIISTDCGFGRQGMSRLHSFYKMIAIVRGTNIVRRELGAREAIIRASDPRFSILGSWTLQRTELVCVAPSLVHWTDTCPARDCGGRSEDDHVDKKSRLDGELNGHYFWCHCR